MLASWPYSSQQRQFNGTKHEFHIQQICTEPKGANILFNNKTFKRFNSIRFRSVTNEMMKCGFLTKENKKVDLILFRFSSWLVENDRELSAS